MADEHNTDEAKSQTDEEPTSNSEPPIDGQASTDTEPLPVAEAAVDTTAPTGVVVTPSEPDAVAEAVASSPSAPSEEPAAAVSTALAVATELVGRGPLPSRGTLAGANVSWEEKRKGIGPETPEGVDEEFYNERFISERQRVDRASSRWEVQDRDNSVQNAPNWPPPLRP